MTSLRSLKEGENMGRDYQRVKNNKYILPRNLYRHTLYVIRDYDIIKLEYDDMLQLSAVCSDGQPKGSGKSDPTALTAARIEKYHDIINAVDNAKKEIPKEYRKGVWQNIVHEAPFPLTAARSTYGLYKSKFVYMVAKHLCLTE